MCDINYLLHPGGILNYVNNVSPGAFHPDVEYITISGKWKQGVDEFSIADFEGWFAGLTYKQTCGVANVWGDGITPCEIAHLDGSEEVTLNGCYHSPIGERVNESEKNMNTNSNNSSLYRPWYGSEDMLKQWHQYI